MQDRTYRQYVKSCFFIFMIYNTKMVASVLVDGLIGKKVKFFKWNFEGRSISYMTFPSEDTTEVICTISHVVIKSAANGYFDLYFFDSCVLASTRVSLRATLCFVDESAEEKLEINHSGLPPLEDCNISTPVFNVIKRSGATTLEELANFTQDKFMKVPGCGQKRFAEVEKLLWEHGLDFKK